MSNANPTPWHENPEMLTAIHEGRCILIAVPLDMLTDRLFRTRVAPDHVLVPRIDLGPDPASCYVETARVNDATRAVEFKVYHPDFRPILQGNLIETRTIRHVNLVKVAREPPK